MRTAVVFLQDPPSWAEELSVEERISLLGKAKPDGLGLTPARAKEATYRAGADGTGGGGGADAARSGTKGGGGNDGVEFTGEVRREGAFWVGVLFAPVRGRVVQVCVRIWKIEGWGRGARVVLSYWGARGFYQEFRA